MLKRGDRIELRVYGSLWVSGEVLREAGMGIDVCDDEGGLWSLDLADEGREWRRPGGTGGVLITALYEAAHAALEAWPRAWVGGGAERAENAYQGLRRAMDGAGDRRPRRTVEVRRADA